MSEVLPGRAVGSPTMLGRALWTITGAVWTMARGAGPRRGVPVDTSVHMDALVIQYKLTASNQGGYTKAKYQGDWTP